MESKRGQGKMLCLVASLIDGVATCGHPQQRGTEATQGRSNDLKLAGIVALGKLLKMKLLTTTSKMESIYRILE